MSPPDRRRTSGSDRSAPSACPVACRALRRGGSAQPSSPRCVAGRGVCWALLAVKAGCAPAPVCETKQPLVDASSWRLVPPADDTLWPPPADAPLCAPEDVQVASFGDDDAVEIDTRFGCGWATVEQPIALALTAGDAVQVRVFYFSQGTFPAAEAEVAVALGDAVIARQRVPIPSSSGLFAPRVVLEGDVAAGTPARFHVGNHGDNSWNLIELSRIVSGPCAGDDPSPG